MRTATLTILSLLVSALSVPSFAHDPNGHPQEGATAPDCSRMAGTDAGEMDMGDPSMKARSGARQAPAGRCGNAGPRE